MDNSKLSREDLRYIWHPCTQMHDHESFPPIPIKSGKGLYLYDFDGNAYIDGISSWWVNIFGHSNDYINAKITHQLGELEHVLLAGFSHEPIIRLSKRLVEITPKKLDRCFYADNGSSAIEVALKMSYHLHKLQGRNRPFFLSLSNSYHGETIGALSVGDVALYKETYGAILFKSIQTPVPKDQSEKSTLEALEALEAILKRHNKEISAMILEPLVQCAGGMHMYAPEYIQGASKLCKEWGIHLIFDEIAVGFGRTGKLFALEWCGITPDFLCLSKGITGGYLPLSVVMMSEECYGAFYAPYEEGKSFLHSHSYTGNALACSAANATLDLLEDGSVLERNITLNAQMASKLAWLAKRHSFIKNSRIQGMIVAFDVEGFKKERRIGREIHQALLKKGVLLRPLGSVVYFMPPYIITPEEIDRVFDALDSVLNALKK